MWFKLLNPKKMVILGLTLLAFILRIYRLDFQSYWIDEGWTVYFANLPINDLFYLLRTEEIHPPFYFPTLNFWRQLVGDSEFALRYYSLVFSVLSIPFIYRLGKDLLDRQLGLISAVLMSVSPFQIWHAQEARMYALLTAASAMSMWGFINLYRRGGWRWRLVYLVGTMWVITAHYHGFLLIGIQGLFLLLTWRRHRHTYLAWGGTVLVALMFYTPWFILSGAFVRDYVGWLDQPSLWETYIRNAQAFSIGELVSGSTATFLLVIFVIIYGAGLLYVAQRRWGIWRGSELLFFLLAYTIAPNIAVWLFGELRNTSVYLERYLISVQVGYLLTIAIGILAVAEGLSTIILWLQSKIQKANQVPSRHLTNSSNLGTKLVAIALLLTLVGINGWVLFQHYFNPVFAKPDWRAVVRHIETFTLPGDAILLTGDGGEKVMNYYYRGNLPVYYSFNTPVPTPGKARQLIAEITANHQRLWYTPYGVDIDTMLEGWLAKNSYPAWHSWLGRKRLALYDTQPSVGRDEVVDVTFSNLSDPGLTLTHITLPGDPVAAGDLLPLNLTWQTNTTLDKDYQLSLRLINNHSDTFAQSDWPPLSYEGGTSSWAANQPIADYRSLWLPPDMPPGEYLLQLVVYDPMSSETLGQPIIIDNIAVNPAEIIVPLQALSIPNFADPRNSKLNTEELTLIGYALPQEIQAGQEMWLWLYWQAKASPPPDTVLRISLVSKSEVVTENYQFAASVGALNSWQPGQVRRAVYHFVTSPRLTGEVAEVKVGLISGQAAEVEASIGQVKLNTRPHRFEVPDITHPTNIAFGNSTRLKLIGYDLSTSSFNPGETLPITLYWQAETEMDINYTVFIQLLNSENQVVAQVDLQPQGGAAPTITWLPNEILTDSYSLPLPVELPSGNYHLITGLYDAATGMRLSVDSGDNFVALGEVTVN